MSTHNIPFLNIKKKIIFYYPKSELWNLFRGTQERVRTSRGKRAISVRAIEVLLYYDMDLEFGIFVEGRNRQSCNRKNIGGEVYLRNELHFSEVYQSVNCIASHAK